jgi:Uncharacterized membrane-associated protein
MIENLFETCGYVASFLGTLLEGEILFLTSVISSKLGYFNFFGGLIAAFFGAFVHDSVKFLLIKKQGRKILDKKPKLQAKLDGASGWFNKRPFLYLTFYRLMYGFNTVIIMLSGLKDNISYPRFAIHSAVSVGLWISILGGFGYFCAEAMIEKLNFMSTHSGQVIGVLVVLGLLYWFFVKHSRDRHCFIVKEED